MKLPDIFFKQLDEIMEGSDSETEVDYIARITMNSRGNSNQTGQKNDSRLGTAFTPPSTQLSRDLKLKTTGSSALRFQSPRNKPTAHPYPPQHDPIGPTDGNEENMHSGDDQVPAGLPTATTPAGSPVALSAHETFVSVSSKHSARKMRKRTDGAVTGVGVRDQGEAAVDTDVNLSEARKYRRKPKSKPKKSKVPEGTSSAPSSPIEGTSALTDQNRVLSTKMSILDLNIAQASASAARKEAERTAALGLKRAGTTLLKPLPKVPRLGTMANTSAEQISMIGNFSSSAPTSPEPTSSSPFPVTSGKAPSKISVKARAPAKTAGKGKSTAVKAKGKQKPEKQSVYDWTITELELWSSGKKKADPKIVQFFRGHTILFVGYDFSKKYMIGETTRKCIRIILKHGGQIAPKYDPTTITHIVLESGLPKANLLEAAHVKTLERIPEHIPLLAWKWVNVLQNMNPDIEPGRPPQEIHLIADEHLYNYGHFSSRLPPVNLHPSAVARTQLRLRKSTNSEFSHISRYPEDVSDSDGSEAPLPIYRQPHGMERPLKAASSRVPLNLQPVHADNTSDPLLAFYLRARENNSLFPRYRNEFDSGTETETSDTETSAEDTSKLKEKRQDGGWLCKDPQKRAAPCPNDDVIEKLEELKTLHSAKPAEDDKWRVFSLNKTIRALRAHPKRIRSLEEAEKIRGIGVKTAMKIMEIINTGDLRRIQFERTEDVLVTSVFTKIYGVGQKTAQMWYSNGCRTLDDLWKGKGGVKLNEGQKIGLEHYNDLNTRMPREEAKAIFELIKPIALRIDPDLFVDIMGSFRRGKADCGDIDILITRCPDDGRTHEGVLRKLIDKLERAGILTEHLALPDYSKPLEAVYHGICCLPGVAGARRRRIDFLTVPWSSKGGALLYYTGDDMFNRSMRLLANKMGYSLNQRGLYAGVIRDPTNRNVKLNAGNLIASETERQIFDKLGVPWREPHERVTYYEDIMNAQKAKRRSERG